MDHLLLPYINSNDESEAQLHLNDLLFVHASPIVRKIMRRRLGFYVSALGQNEHNQDAEDLYQETMTRIVQLLTALRTGSVPEIENFKHYVARTAANICTDLLRAKSPARTHLKDAVRDLIRRESRLASWERESETVCGLTVWDKTDMPSAWFSNDLEIKAQSFVDTQFPDTAINTLPLSVVVMELMEWLGEPIRLEELINVLAYLLGIKEHPVESLDTDSDMPIATGESEVGAIELLEQLWRALKLLPAEQRDVFILGFEDAAGQDLVTALLVAKVATIKDLAAGLGKTVEEILRLRLLMPMDSAGIAAELNTSRSNVYKWRFRAIRRLQTELNR